MSGSDRLLLAVVVLLSAVLALAPLAVGVEALAFARERPGVVALIERAGPICHHRPERTLVVGGRLLPVCARCTGLYVGTAVGGLLGVMLGRRQRLEAATATAGALAVIGVVAGIAEAAGVVSTGNGLRFALGLPLGLGPTMIAGLGVRVLVDELRGAEPR